MAKAPLTGAATAIDANDGTATATRAAANNLVIDFDMDISH